MRSDAHVGQAARARREYKQEYRDPRKSGCFANTNPPADSCRLRRAVFSRKSNSEMDEWEYLNQNLK